MNRSRLHPCVWLVAATFYSGFNTLLRSDVLWFTLNRRLGYLGRYVA